MIVTIAVITLVLLVVHVQMVRLGYRHGLENLPNSLRQLSGQLFVQLILFPIYWICVGGLVVGHSIDNAEIDVKAKVERFSQTRAKRRELTKQQREQEIAALEQEISRP